MFFFLTFQVIGINNLRVADASIMPNIVSGHTNIPVIAIGEKISDVIKKEHGFIKMSALYLLKKQIAYCHQDEYYFWYKVY